MRALGSPFSAGPEISDNRRMAGHMKGPPQPGAQSTLFAPAERASREQLERQRAIFEGLRLLRVSLDAMPNMVLVVNRHRQVVYANQALLVSMELKDAGAFLGLRPGELLGCIHSDETQGGCGTTDFCRVCGTVRALLAGLSGKEAMEECRITGKETIYDLRVWATPFRHEGEDFVIYSILDISDEKRRIALETIFFHDVLNTAGGIKGLAEILGEATGEEAESIRRMVVRSSRKLVEEIISQRDLHAAERGDLTLSTSKVDAVEFIESIAELYRSHAVAEGRTIAVDDAPDKPALRTDRVLLARVVGNMLKNALESCPNGGRVTVSCAKEGDRVAFRVSNPEVMPEDVRLQMFQRSFSTKGVGRGLGTYSMKLLAERYLKGDVSFESSEEKGGTTFYARFPAELRAETPR